MSRFALSFLIATVANSAQAGSTAWINPAGGAWSDAANWTAGVPTSNDTVILPTLGSAGYVIELAGTQVAGHALVQTGSSAVTLHGGMLQVSTAIDVGSANNAGALVLDATVVQTTALLIGESGTSGSLSFCHGAAAIATSTRSGHDGSGTIIIRSGCTLAGGTMIFGSSSALHLDAKPSPALRVIALSGIYDGALIVDPDPEMTLPSPPVQLATAWQGFAGSFSSTSAPVIDGVGIPVSATSYSIDLNAMDPLVSLVITLPQLPIYAGFAHSISVIELHTSGLMEFPCAPVCDGITWSSSDESIANIDGMGKLATFAPGSVTISASDDVGGSVISGSIAIDVRTDVPFHFERVATNAAGVPADADTQPYPGSARWSANGRWVAFGSWATNLGADPTRGSADIFVKDRETGVVDVASVAGAWGSASFDSTESDISGDGRFVTFLRRGQVPGRGASYDQVWLRDRLLGTTVLVSHGASGDFANSPCAAPRLAADGSTVVYSSKSTNLVRGVAVLKPQLFAYDVVTGATTLLTLGINGQAANGECVNPTISANAQRVAFETTASNFVPNPSGMRCIVMLDRSAGTFTRIDVSSSGEGSTGISQLPCITSDGRYVAFESTASELGAPNDAGMLDVFVRDVMASTTTFVSPSVLGGNPSVAHYRNASISDDGNYVAFIGSPLSPQFEDGLELRRVNVHTLEGEFVALDPWGELLPVWISTPQLSPTGAQVLFTALEAQLVPNGVPLRTSTFVRALGPFVAADLNQDGAVNAADLSILLGAWGMGGPADLDGDGAVGASDLALLLGSWS